MCPDTSPTRVHLSLAALLLVAAFAFFAFTASGQTTRAAAAARGTRRAIVIDERLAALRDEPRLTSTLVRRLGRGRQVTIIGPARQADGLRFYRIALTRRTRGWLLAESLALPAHPKEDERLWRLIEASQGFDRLARARLFLDFFPRSMLRPRVLLLFGDVANEIATSLSQEAGRRLNPEKPDEVRAYFLSYRGLDRYNRHGVVFAFDPATKLFHYEGASWREVLRRYPQSPEAAMAQQRLVALSRVARQR